MITRTPVYPRWRGEHFSHIFSMSCAAGLSPLARGTHKHCSYVNWINRFIPAGAGNTQTGSFSTARPAVYPRWRGEHLRDNFIEQVTGGLSPLARGTPLRSPREYPAHRFIPAGAGNTAPGNRLNPVLPVYPRWRGEHVLRGWIVNAANGLSPLARGTH